MIVGKDKKDTVTMLCPFIKSSRSTDIETTTLLEEKWKLMYKKFGILMWKYETLPLDENSTSRWKIKGFHYTSL